MPDDKHHAKPQIDVRTLNLAQLKMLADKGSRRARAAILSKFSTRFSVCAFII